MRYLVVAAAAVVLAFTALVGVRIGQTDDRAGSSPERTAYSFIHAMKHNNFGRACSYFTDQYRGDVDRCSQGYLESASMFIMFLGKSPFVDAAVVPGTREELEDGRVTYQVGFWNMDTGKLVPSATLIIVEGPNGKWRIDDIVSIK